MWKGASCGRSLCDSALVASRAAYAARLATSALCHFRHIVCTLARVSPWGTEHSQERGEAMSTDLPCLPPGAAGLLPAAPTTPVLLRPRRLRQTVHADQTSAVAAALLQYLQRRLGIPNLHYAVNPTPVSDGWE